MREHLFRCAFTIANGAFACFDNPQTRKQFQIFLLVGFLRFRKTLIHSGATIGERDLELAIGVRWRGRVPWSAVATIETVTEAPTDAINASILGANVVVRLRAPTRLHGVFGREREGTVIALSIDEQEAFVAAARAAMLRT